jgi:hypothetical protein
VRTRIRVAKILDVDPAKFTATIQYLGSEGVVGDVPISSPFLDIEGGAHSGGMPRAGSFYLVVFPENASQPVVWGGYPLPTPDVGQAEGMEDRESAAGPRDDFSSSRAFMAPGDQGLFGYDGAKVALRSSGVLELFMDEMCWTRYFMDQHAIRSMARAVMHSGWWGAVEGFVLDDNLAEDAEGAPTGARVIIKNRTQGAAHVLMEAGSIPDEAGVQLAGVPVQDQGTLSEVCMRLLVYDQETADAYHDMGQFPPAEQARVMIKVDQEGNSQVRLMGMLDLMVKRLLLSVEERVVAEVHGATQMILNGLDIESSADARVVSDTGILLKSRGDVRIRARRFIVEALNDIIATEGAWGVDAGGAVSIAGASGLNLRSGRDLTVTAAGDRADSTAGRLDVLVSGQGPPSWKTTDTPTHRTRLREGKMVLETHKGSVEMKLNPSGSPAAPPLSAIRIVGDPTQPHLLGRVEVLAGILGTGLVADVSGLVSVGNVAGGVLIDPTGRVQLGLRQGVVGNVVTSTSHLDYMTGLPLRGAPEVVVVSALPGIPAPGVPVVPPLPFIPTPDLIGA